MDSVAALAVLIIALVISAQVLMLMRRGRPLAKRLRDLSWGGDASSLLLVAALLCGPTGLLLGSFTNHPAVGLTLGLAIALLTWTTAVTCAHRTSNTPPRHRLP